jgi:hypothetical protein
MTNDELLRKSFVSVEVNESFSEAVVLLRDGSKLCFCHRVGERWAKAFGKDQSEKEAGSAGALLSGIAMFRLNAKHLDVEFADGSRWELRLKSSARER